MRTLTCPDAPPGAATAPRTGGDNADAADAPKSNNTDAATNNEVTESSPELETQLCCWDLSEIYRLAASAVRSAPDYDGG